MPSAELTIMAAMAQDMMRGVDLSSPDMVSAETTRGEIEAALTAATVAAPADFTGKKLSSRDLSGLDLSVFALRASTRPSLPVRISIVQSSTRHGCSKRT
jgi:hypothetical protein